MDYNFLAYITSLISAYMPDFRKQKIEADADLDHS
jgi:hypothetical protein